jgi:hypothetical protein
MVYINGKNQVLLHQETKIFIIYLVCICLYNHSKEFRIRTISQLFDFVYNLTYTKKVSLSIPLIHSFVYLLVLLFVLLCFDFIFLFTGS